MDLAGLCHLGLGCLHLGHRLFKRLAALGTYRHQFPCPVVVANVLGQLGLGDLQLGGRHIEFGPADGVEFGEFGRSLVRLSCRRNLGPERDVARLCGGKFVAEDDGDGLALGHVLPEFDVDAADDAAEQRDDRRFAIAVRLYDRRRSDALGRRRHRFADRLDADARAFDLFGRYRQRLIARRQSRSGLVAAEGHRLGRRHGLSAGPRPEHIRRRSDHDHGRRRDDDRLHLCRTPVGLARGFADLVFVQFIFVHFFTNSAAFAARITSTRARYVAICRSIYSFSISM